MKLLRIYPDTSVIGGCCDKEFAPDSMRVIDGILSGKAKIIVSEILMKELDKAPDQVRRVLTSIPPEFVEMFLVTPEVADLRNAYIDAKIVGKNCIDDAFHVAAATVARADAIVSWNFKHIVRLDKIKAYNQVNLSMGYGILTILSPKEVFFDESPD